MFPNVCVCQVFQQRFSPAQTLLLQLMMLPGHVSPEFSPAQTLLQLMMLPGHVSPEFSPALTLHTRFTA